MIAFHFRWGIVYSNRHTNHFIRIVSTELDTEVNMSGAYASIDIYHLQTYVFDYLWMYLLRSEMPIPAFHDSCHLLSEVVSRSGLWQSCTQKIRQYCQRPRRNMHRTHEWGFQPMKGKKMLRSQTQHDFIDRDRHVSLFVRESLFRLKK